MIKTFIKPMIYSKNRLESAEQIAAGTYKNFDYYVLNLHTHPTAYVDVSDSPLNGWDYDYFDISCHGGLGYSESTLQTVDKKGWFIGWDYAHYGDYADYDSNMYLNGKKWTTEEIVEECKNVIDQIVAKYYKETKKMKYKVEDKVRIVSEWGKGCNQNPDGKMDKWLGKNMTIRDIYYGYAYKMKEDATEWRGDGWIWSENNIAGFACENKIVITTDGRETLARLYDGNKVIKTATAKCSPDDKFDFETGATIAFDRLFDKHEKEEPKYFNGKVVCVNEYLGFTVGKIYEFVNGQCFDDQKMLRPACTKCKDLAFFEGVFIRIVE